MNERIKLPAQEWLGYDPDRGDIHGYTFQQMREFAELIVQECASLCEVTAAGRDAEDIAQAILAHFGVKV
jgi:hypothetical protein